MRLFGKLSVRNPSGWWWSSKNVACVRIVVIPLFVCCSNKWNNLLAHIQARDQKLQAAGEIHRFNRDVADALARIQEKVSSIPEGVGRDLNACESMLRIHESFETDLLALEAQLQVVLIPT